MIFTPLDGYKNYTHELLGGIIYTTTTRYTLAVFGKASLASRSFIVYGILLKEAGKRTGEQLKKRFSTKTDNNRGFFTMDDETFLNERIQVAAVFKEGLDICRPLRFRRASGREVEVTEVGLRHPSSKGLRTIHMFDVTDGGTDYRLEFDTERLTWHLTREATHCEE